MSLGARYLVFAVLCFNVMQVCVKLLPNIPFFELIFFRALISFAISLVWLKKAKIPMWGKNKPLLVARGLAGTFALAAYFFALQRAPLSIVVSLQDLSPFFSLIFVMLFLKEATPVKQWPLFGLALLGMIVLRSFTSQDRIDDLSFTMAFLSAVGAGVAYALVRILSQTEHPQVVVFYFPLVTLPIVAPISLLHWVTPVGLEWVYIIGIGLFTHVAQIALTMAFQLERLNQVIIYKNLGPVFAVLFGITIFHDLPSWTELIGIGIIILAVVLMKLIKTEPSSGPVKSK